MLSVCVPFRGMPYAFISLDTDEDSCQSWTRSQAMSMPPQGDISSFDLAVS